jgi:hypothetical protein
MRTFSVVFLLLIHQVTAWAQDQADYYNPYYNQVLPGQTGIGPYRNETGLPKLAENRIDNRWYIGIDGFARTEKNTISNTFDGLVGTESPDGYAWGAVLGWVGHENWGIEAEYARAPIRNILIINGDSPLQYTFNNDKNTVILRGKRRILFGKSDLRRSAFWVGAGLGIVPNSGKQTDYKSFIGYKPRGRGQGRDTLGLVSDTRTSNHITGLADVSAEYVLKAAKSIDISFFLRRQWGLGTSVFTNLDYYINSVKTQSAVIKSDGSGWKLGISLRYVFQIGYGSENIGRNAD